MQKCWFEKYVDVTSEHQHAGAGWGGLAHLLCGHIKYCLEMWSRQADWMQVIGQVS